MSENNRNEKESVAGEMYPVAPTPAAIFNCLVSLNQFTRLMLPRWDAPADKSLSRNITEDSK